MDLGIKGKLALVTASSAGLGAAIANKLAQEGTDLILFSRNKIKLNEMATFLQKTYSVKVHVVAGDMSIEKDVHALTQFIQTQTSGLDILVLNSGRPPTKMQEVLQEKDFARWTQAHQTQLWGPLLIVQNVIPLMIGRADARVVGISSSSVKQPMKKHALSTVYRAGVAGMFKHLANELADQGITVNLISPASIGTEALVSSYNIQDRIQQVPMKRIGTPEEFATVVAFFCSVHTGFITGINVNVDGGMILGM